MYYPTNRDAEHRESEQRIAEHYRRAESIERFADRSRFLIAAQEAKREGFTHFAEALEKLSKNNQMEDDTMKRKAKTGPKPENGVGRTRLMGCGPVVSRATNDALKLWRDVHGVPLGRAIDAMFEHIKDNPAFRIPKRGIMSQAKLDREVQNQWTEASSGR